MEYDSQRGAVDHAPTPEKIQRHAAQRKPRPTRLKPSKRPRVSLWSWSGTHGNSSPSQILGRENRGPLHYVLFALPPVTSRRMPGVISFTPPARDPVER